MRVINAFDSKLLENFQHFWKSSPRKRPSCKACHFSTLVKILRNVIVFITYVLTAGGPFNDWVYSKLKARNGNIGRPEFRVVLMLPGSILIPIGLFIYGWSGQSHTQWIVPNIGVVIFCTGTIMCFQGIQTYTIDAYPRYAASAISTLNALRSLTGFGFPLFAPAMYSKLGNGWGNTLLAFMMIGIAITGPAALWRFGPWLRGKSSYASGDQN